MHKDCSEQQTIRLGDPYPSHTKATTSLALHSLDLNMAENRWMGIPDPQWTDVGPHHKNERLEEELC